MRRKRHLDDRAQIIDPVQIGRVLCEVVPANEQVDRVRVPGSERFCEGTTDPGCRGRRAERVEMADLVQPNVAFDELCKLDRVA